MFETAKTRAIALQWLTHVQNHHYDKLDELAAPDANWWVAGLKEKIPVAGDMPYHQRQVMLGELDAKGDESSTTLIRQVTEGHTSILEVFKKAKNGDRVYENDAVVIIRVNADHKIEEVREYLDYFALFKYMGVPGFA